MWRLLSIRGEAELPGFPVENTESVAEALDRLRATHFDVLLASFPIPGWTPAELLEHVQRVNSRIPIVIREPGGTVQDAVRLAKLGAEQYLTGALDPAQLAAVAESGRRRQSARVPSGEPWKRVLVGESRPIREIECMVRLVGGRRCTVLITGETGTGKENVAQALHLAGPRSALPMMAVNCSALPESLLEAELFGHVRGAFTGAVQHRMGRFEQAHGSTLFLDEVGDMPLELQAKILRVLQAREFQRLGSCETVRVDVRVIAASHFDLVELVRQGRFREDLYYRLNVVPIHMPPLRERLSDVPLLADHFLEKVCRTEQIPVKRICDEALSRLAAYSWPGNVRQLENAVEMAVALSGERQMLYPGDFPLPCPLPVNERGAAPVVALPDQGLDFERTLSSIEKSILDQALRRTGGNKKLAADLLRLKRTTLSAKLRSLTRQLTPARQT